MPIQLKSVYLKSQQKITFQWMPLLLLQRMLQSFVKHYLAFHLHSAQPWLCGKLKDVQLEEIAKAIGTTPANVRHVVTRARASFVRILI